MVVGANRFKGYKGVIRDTTPSGEALLEMLTFNHPRRERFFLDQLRFLYVIYPFVEIMLLRSTQA